MQISIIISTSNRGEIFTKTLTACIEAVSNLNAEIIVVHDRTYNSFQVLAQTAVPVAVLRSPRPGVAAKRNLGAANARGTLLLFLDDDILTSDAVIGHMIKLHESAQDICVNPNWVYPANLMRDLPSSAFGRFLLAYNFVGFKGWYGDPSWKDNALFQSKSIASFHLSISRENFLKSGGYNENFAEAGFEDYDYPKRLKEADLRFFIDSSVCVFHNEEDRTTIRPWLVRQQRGAFTRREAVTLGYTEMSIHYGVLKKATFRFIAILQPLLLLGLSAISKYKGLDRISFQIVLLLQAHHIYKGYSHPVKRS
ncbi:MAG: glycosyltransferase [Cyclobacteriaceae bacterium]|nr:glycosyltransferase [Cyclobacteriaceae bacterium]